MMCIWRKKRPWHIFTILLPLALLLFGSGCATFPGKDIPAYTFADFPPAPENKQCLVISDKCTKGTCPDVDTIISLLEKSGYFLKGPERCIRNSTDKSKAMNVNFDQTFRTGPYLVDLINAFVSGYTLTLIPGRYREYYVMKVQFKHNDQVVKQYEYHDHIESWTQLFYLFKRPDPDYSKNTAVHEMYDRMIMNFLYDYTHDLQKGDVFAGY